MIDDRLQTAETLTYNNDDWGFYLWFLPAWGFKELLVLTPYQVNAIIKIVRFEMGQLPLLGYYVDHDCHEKAEVLYAVFGSWIWGVFLV